MEVTLKEEINTSNWKQKDKYSNEKEFEKHQKHFLSRPRTKKLSTLGNSEFPLLYIFIVLQGIIFGSLIPSSDAKLFPSHTSSNQIFHDGFTTGDKIFSHLTSDTTLRQIGQNKTSQGKIFLELITTKYCAMVLYSKRMLKNTKLNI